MSSNNNAITKILATVIIAIILITTISGVILYHNIIPPEPQNTPTPQPTPTLTPTPTSTPRSTPLPEIPSEKTLPKNQGTIRIGSNTFSFDATQVETIRPDIFNPGYFSVFDVLVHLHKQGQISLQYHFDESMNTHIIDEIDGETDWWYQIYYSGGWPERNVFRPDHYPWKDQTTLTFYKETPSRISSIYAVWEEEITRKSSNNQEVIIPQFEIRSKSFTLTFENVKVTPHNLRNDVFVDGTITAIDTILPLSDQGKISYELQYYESIGTAGIVKSYWVEAINQDVASGRAGYVYEAGSTRFRFSSGNHIHLPSDTRVLNSPEYVEYFWISL
ncbi:MAG: hypothetical protein NWE84_00260 [Candidatus Bathyarchaeota archaeon]|nr:hypothetical protein [Candidatus Bathyarchaeota archaeon]